MIWYPYTNLALPKTHKIIDAKGVYLHTEDQVLIDSISSWWCVIHGYKHPKLNAAITQQLNKFSHVMLAGLSHEVVEKLSDKLKNWLPGDLDYCFYSDSGSVAVEVALKMALQFYKNQQEPQRQKVLALKHAYHGDTFKAMEVSDQEYHYYLKNNKEKNSNVIHINADINELQETFEKYHHYLNCFIVEPLLQGAAGMRMYDIAFLKRARELCNKYHILLIFDEVATGFGRTGHRFVADVVQPDILVLGKALTGGYIGHAVTVTNKKVFDCFHDKDVNHALMHGPTFMGNALACSVALASIEIFEKDNYLEKIQTIEATTHRILDNFSHPLIKEIRIMGASACIEVWDPNSIKGFSEFAYKRGIFVRPFLNYMYTMVPYIITESELSKILQTMKDWFEK